MERIRIGEEAVLKTVGCKSLGGSSPSLSAKSQENFLTFLFDSQFYFFYFLKKLSNNMSRLTELKKQYPHLTLSFFDLMVKMDKSKTYKYLPLLCKLFNSKFTNKNASTSKDWDNYVNDCEQHISATFPIQNLTEKEILVFYMLSEHYSRNFFSSINNFIDYVEENKISNPDLSKYNSLSDIEQEVSLAEFKCISKELEGQVVKEFEDENYVAVRPLTFSASAKYGAGTRWCTTYQKEKQYFERYWRNGILVYFIHKLTGYKFAMHKDFESHDVSFWTADDNRVDFFNLLVDDYLYPIVKKIVQSKQSNRDLCSDELKKIVVSECIDYQSKCLARVSEEPMDIDEIIPAEETMNMNMTVMRPAPDEHPTQYDDYFQRA